MSDEEVQGKALGLAHSSLSGKSDSERAALLHQHIGSRAMVDMVIETFAPSSGTGGVTSVKPLYQGVGGGQNTIMAFWAILVIHI